MKRLIGWRVCVGKPRRGGAWLVWALHPGDTSTLVFQNGKLAKMAVHVGTTRDFCIDYYKGIAGLKPGESELLLCLDCTAGVWPEHAERWAWTCPTEAQVDTPVVLGIEVLSAYAKSVATG